MIEHFQNAELSDCVFARGCLLGKPGEDLRFVGIFSKSEKQVITEDFDKIDKEIDYNGDHAFLKSHPEFNLEPQFPKHKKTEN